jgi:hypothetical protein
MNSLLAEFTSEDYIFLHENLLLLFILLGGVMVNRYHQTEKWGMINNFLLLCYVVLNVFLWGGRANNIGTDTYNYYTYFFVPIQKSTSLSMVFTLFYLEPLFKVLLFISSRFESYNVFLFSVSFIINLSLYFFVRIITDKDKHGSSLILYLTIASMFSFTSIQFNIIRNGIGIVFLFIGMAHLVKGQWKKFIFYSLIALLFHQSMIIPILFACIANSKRIPLWFYLVAYIGSIVLSLKGYGVHSLSFLLDLGSNKIDSYIAYGDTTYRVGFRWDFCAYNTFFLLIFLLLNRFGSDIYTILLKYFIATSCLFFLSFYIPFSDRIGLYSWIAIPVLLFIGFSIRYSQYRLLATSVSLLSFYIISRILIIYMNS